MKKVLLATTALAFSVSYAAAEVAVSGDGRMGVVFSNNAEGDTETNFTSRARVKFTLTGETDTGLSFGGSFRVDHENGLDDNIKFSRGVVNDGTGDLVKDADGLASKGAAGSVYVSGSYGKLTMGDIDGAIESANGDLYGVGLTGLGDFNEPGYYGSGGEENGNPGALYEYGFGAATVYVSMYDGDYTTPTDNEDDDDAAVADLFDALPQGDAWSVGGKYSTDAFTVGLGYVNSDDADTQQVALSGEGTFAGVGLKAVYVRTEFGGSVFQRDGNFELDEYGLSGKYTFGETEVAGFWTRFDASDDNSVDVFGIGASYDLGGGASVVGGIVDSNEDGADPIGDLGVSFKF